MSEQEGERGGGRGREEGDEGRRGGELLLLFFPKFIEPHSMPNCYEHHKSAM